MDLEFRIKPILQRSNYDCGQTCLDMLGYDGHGMFPNEEVSSSDLRSIHGAREATVPIGQEETLDYSIPHIWILLGKDKVAGAQHWVIRHEDKIYCPTVGIMDAQDYKNSYVAFIMQEFAVPFNGQELTDIVKDKKPQMAVTSPTTEKVDSPQEENRYELIGRTVEYIGERKLSNGIRQFGVKYLDNPAQDGWPKEKRGEIGWHGDWQLSRLRQL